MYMNMYVATERFYQQPNQPVKDDKYFSDYDEEIDDREGGGGSGGPRRFARDAAPASPAKPPTPAANTTVKVERLSPHESSASRSRSVTPSTSSFPGTPPERGSPHAPHLPTVVQPPRNYSDIMRSLAARYNTSANTNNDYIHRINGFGVEARAPPSPAQADVTSDTPLGGLFTQLAKQLGGPPRLPAFPVMFDMSSTKALLALSRANRSGRARRKRAGVSSAPEHSPLDLSAASENIKRARLSASPSTRSDSDDKERIFNDDRNENRSECLCAEAKARLSAWSVEDVCEFVSSIDICAEYAMNFREQRIDGAGLPLLTEDHLTGMLQMKLGPALKLKAILATKLQPCANCQQANSANLALSNNNVSPKLNGTSLKSEPRSNTTSPS